MEDTPLEAVIRNVVETITEKEILVEFLAHGISVSRVHRLIRNDDDLSLVVVYLEKK